MMEPNGGRTKSSTRKRRPPRSALMLLFLFIWNVKGLIIGFLLLTWIRPCLAPDEFRDGYEGHGTTHEQMGQPHWSEVEYTDYESEVLYTVPPPYSSLGLSRLFNLTHIFFENTMSSKPFLPPGYVVVKSEDTLALGPKASENDWRDFLAEYWLLFLWVIFLLVIIILMPFIAVCYCCFCCCRRCRPGCPPCDHNRDARRRFICGLLLLLIIIFLLIGALIAALSDRLLDRGLGESNEAMRRTAEDTCNFLKDVSNHVHHLFGYNYEEMLTHLTDMLTESNSHIFMDIGDVSGSNALEHLERIFDNMPEALKLMKEVNSLEKELRFLISNIRDGVRDVKRDVTYACILSGPNWRCQNFLRGSQLEFLDTSKCLHIDQLPDTQKYVDGIEMIIKKEQAVIPKRALRRLQVVSDMITKELEKVAPPLVRDLARGRDEFLHQADIIRSIIEAIISDIHMNTLKSTKSFEDVYVKFGSDRTVINLIICLFLFLIPIVLIVALICGCCFVKTSGAALLLLAIILIFCVFSFITLVGLFYFIMGVVTYQGACAPLRDVKSDELFLQLDAVIDLNRYLPTGEQEPPSPELRMSNAIKACRIEESIFQVLRDNKLYDINELTRLHIMHENESHVFDIQEDLSNVLLLTKDEKIELSNTSNGNLSSYHSVNYMDHMCKQLTPVTLGHLVGQLSELEKDLYTFYGGFYTTRTRLNSNIAHLNAYEREWVSKVSGIHDQLRRKLRQIDELILYNNNDFGSSIRVLVAAITRAEKFMQQRGTKFITQLIENLTIVIDSQVEGYVDRVITHCNTRVGQCGLLAQAYYRSADRICIYLVDPINGFWIGVLLCALLFLPLLFVAHRLMCLYKIYTPLALPAMMEGGCPICTGAPYVPPPVVICGGGQQATCVCENAPRRVGGNIVQDFIILNDQPYENYVGNDAEPSSSNKRKKD